MNLQRQIWLGRLDPAVVEITRMVI